MVELNHLVGQISVSDHNQKPSMSLPEIWHILRYARVSPIFKEEKDFSKWDRVFTDEKQNVYRLHLGRNRLERVPQLRFDHLTQLDLYDNQLRTVPDFIGLPSLEYLFLQSNRLRHVPDFRHLSKLKRLHLNNNYLKHVPDFQHLPELETLLLNDNNLTSVPKFRQLKKITVINIDRNCLTTRPDYSHLPYLKFLVLRQSFDGFRPSKHRKIRFRL